MWGFLGGFFGVLLGGFFIAYPGITSTWLILEGELDPVDPSGVTSSHPPL
jgi:hypothetical protein